MEEEFEADYPTQDEQEVPEREDQHEVADSDSESSSCGEIEEEEKGHHHEPQDGGHMVAEGSNTSQRGLKRTREDLEEEEGELNDDSDIQVKFEYLKYSHYIFCYSNLEMRPKWRLFTISWLNLILSPDER